MGRRLRVVVSLSVVASFALLAGCSVGPQARPVVLGPPPTHHAVLDAPLPTSTSVETFFVHDGRLVPVVRRVAVGPGLEPCLAGLVLPLTAKESAEGLRSALPTGVTRLRGTVKGSIASVTVPSGFDRLTVSDQILAVAQVVFTITANSYLTRVVMVQDGRPLPMPDQSGQLVDRPLARRDYAAVAPRPSSTVSGPSTG